MFTALELIKTKNKVITVRGKVLYNDRKRKIDLKKPIRDLFDSSSMNVFYMMELCLSKDMMLERVKHLAEKDVMPVILYFMNGGKKNE
ncbi:MAG: hypothetical protein ACOCUR_00990 [Nanoarchaeota archaeon]